jgi:hypothetical protein
MPNVSVTNLTGTPVVLAGGFYTAPIDGGVTVTFEVPDTDEFLGLDSIVSQVAAGYIRVTRVAADSETRPLPVFTNVAAFPPAANFPQGTMIMDASGAGGDYLYLNTGVAWVVAIATP